MKRSGDVGKREGRGGDSERSGEGRGGDSY